MGLHEDHGVAKGSEREKTRRRRPRATGLRRSGAQKRATIQVMAMKEARDRAQKMASKAGKSTCLQRGCRLQAQSGVWT